MPHTRPYLLLEKSTIASGAHLLLLTGAPEDDGSPQIMTMVNTESSPWNGTCGEPLASRGSWSGDTRQLFRVTCIAVSAKSPSSWLLNGTDASQTLERHDIGAAAWRVGCGTGGREENTDNHALGTLRVAHRQGTGITAGRNRRPGNALKL